MSVLCLKETFQLHKVLFTNCLFLWLWFHYSAQEVFSCINKFKATFHTFSSIIFSESCFMVRSLTCLDLSFVQGDKYGSICLLPHAVQNPVWAAPFGEFAIFFLVCISGFFLKYQDSNMFWFMPISSIWSACLILCQYHALFYCPSSEVYL